MERYLSAGGIIECSLHWKASLFVSWQVQTTVNMAK